MAAPLAVASRENWVPDDDYVSTQPSSSGGRYVQQDFYYAAGRTINMGGSGGGLEMKYHQNKYDGGAYCPYGFWPVAVPTWQWHWNRFTGAPGVSACM